MFQFLRPFSFGQINTYLLGRLIMTFVRGSAAPSGAVTSAWACRCWASWLRTETAWTWYCFGCGRKPWPCLWSESAAWNTTLTSLLLLACLFVDFDLVDVCCPAPSGLCSVARHPRRRHRAPSAGLPRLVQVLLVEHFEDDGRQLDRVVCLDGHSLALLFVHQLAGVHLACGRLQVDDVELLFWDRLWAGRTHRRRWGCVGVCGRPASPALASASWRTSGQTSRPSDGSWAFRGTDRPSWSVRQARGDWLRVLSASRYYWPTWGRREWGRFQRC